jgi:hypothetical protein
VNNAAINMGVQCLYPIRVHIPSGICLRVISCCLSRGSHKVTELSELLISGFKDPSKIHNFLAFL